MTENQIRECALRCISLSQDSCGVRDDDVYQRYTVAFNDGVVSLMTAILDELNETEDK